MAEQNNNEQKKLDTFAQAIMQHAQDECASITGELSDYTSREIEKYGQETRAGFEHFAEREIAAAIRDGISEVNEQKGQLKKSLYQKREEYAEQVFGAVRKKLVDFTNTDDYFVLMLQKAKEACAAHEESGSVIKVRPCDIEMAKKLAELFENAVAEADDEIKIGGFILQNSEYSFKVDESFDNILKNHREWFYANSGLEISF